MAQSESPFSLTDLSNKVEIGSRPGTLWSLSSQKPGHGVRQLRDADLEQLWQSDGTQPHRITIDFGRRTAVTHVSLWLNVRRDDSYTPTKVLVEAGTDYHDLTEVRFRQWDSDASQAIGPDGVPGAGQPHGWKHFYLGASPARSIMEEEELSGEEQKRLFGEAGGLEPIWTWMIQISVLANHQNGKDTHVRGCLVWGPKEGQGQGQGLGGASEPVTSIPAAPGEGEDIMQEDDEEDEAYESRGAVNGAAQQARNQRGGQAFWRSLR